MRVSIKVRILDDRGVPFMGPGPLRLLERIGRLGSINRAAGDMKLSYVKALRMLGRLEKALGRKLVVRRRGGCDRGGTELTPYALRFMHEFEKLEKAMRRKAHENFETFRSNVVRAGRGRRPVGHAPAAGRGPARVQGRGRKKR